MMPLDRERMVEEILQSWHQIFHEMQKNAAPDWLHLDLTMAQLKALVAIARDGSPAIGTLAESLGVGLSAASQIAERLVQQGLVDRLDDPSDRRRSFVRLSPAGQQLVARLREGRWERVRDLISRLKDDDLAALVRGLRALADLAPQSPGGSGNTPR